MLATRANLFTYFCYGWNVYGYPCCYCHLVSRAKHGTGHHCTVYTNEQNNSCVFIFSVLRIRYKSFGSGLKLFSDSDSNPDPAKSFGSFRTRIRNTDFYICTVNINEYFDSLNFVHILVFKGKLQSDLIPTLFDMNLYCFDVPGLDTIRLFLPIQGYNQNEERARTTQLGHGTSRYTYWLVVEDPDSHVSALVLVGWIRIRVHEGKSDPKK